MENFISNEPRKSSCIGGGRLSVTFNSANKPENLPILAIHDTVYPCLVNPCKRGTKMVEVHATPVPTLPHSSVSRSMSRMLKVATCIQLLFQEVGWPPTKKLGKGA